MSEIGHNSDPAHARLRSIVERIERLQEERKALSADISGVYKEAKSAGFSAKALREVVRVRAMDQSARCEHEVLVDLYRAALGM